MKIILKDNWLGKMLNHPTNACVFAWGILCRLVAVIAASVVAVGYVWIWCMAFHDGWLEGNPMAFVVWFFLTVIAVVVAVASRDFWYESTSVKKLRELIVDVCPTIEWDKDDEV